MMGNLGRPGYEATSDGLWPYSFASYLLTLSFDAYRFFRYDSCDVGTLPNQTDASGNPTAAASAGGNPKFDNNLSWLPGQRLS